MLLLPLLFVIIINEIVPKLTKKIEKLYILYNIHYIVIFTIVKDFLISWCKKHHEFPLHYS